jgi:Tfp pilus assembly protein PilP
MQRFTETALLASVVVALLTAGVSPVCAADLKERLLIPEETRLSPATPATSRGFPGRAIAQTTETQNTDAQPAQTTETQNTDAQPAQTTETQNTDAQPADQYEAEGRRDPFESLIGEKQSGVKPGPVRDPSRPRGPLEGFDLSALHLTGIVWGKLGRRAVIRAPDGKGYFVTVGMYMGQNGGQVVEIENHRVVILEKHRDVKGRIIDKTLTIPLRREE